MPAAVCPTSELRETEAQKKGESLCEHSGSAAINNSYLGYSTTATRATPQQLGKSKV